MKLHYNNVTRKTKNTDGVEIKLPEWGQTEAIEWIDSRPIVDHFDQGAYFYHIVLALTNRGYTRGVNLFGAPYDFRKGPSKNFKDLYYSFEWKIKEPNARSNVLTNNFWSF